MIIFNSATQAKPPPPNIRRAQTDPVYQSRKRRISTSELNDFCCR
ncbi:MAG: hypothetical protein ACLRMJ_05830 [Alistipes finegoldii]